eukprot:2104862-Pyramimonas_sp.AAC.1
MRSETPSENRGVGSRTSTTKSARGRPLTAHSMEGGINTGRRGREGEGKRKAAHRHHYAGSFK